MEWTVSWCGLEHQVDTEVDSVDKTSETIWEVIRVHTAEEWNNKLQNFAFDIYPTAVGFDQRRVDLTTESGIMNLDCISLSPWHNPSNYPFLGQKKMAFPAPKKKRQAEDEKRCEKLAGYIRTLGQKCGFKPSKMLLQWGYRGRLSPLKLESGNLSGMENHRF